MLKKLLIANRGEIAIRVIRACREMGVESVAVYSDLDRDAPYVRMADAAYPLHGETSAQTYLSIEKLLDVAARAGCDAVHPGYGFLSERAVFARAVTDAGMAFVGPPAEAIELMGDKLAARSRMAEVGVPLVPGSDGGIDAASPELPGIAEAVGYPLLVKAAMGGGGKGMRVVETPDKLAAAVRQAASEAGAAFGDGTVYLERYLTRPRHIEVQVLGDQHGTLVHLGERECSIQRRHQKLVEECPAPTVDAALRARLGEAALSAARSVGYFSAGTVEFLLEGDEFFFLEMNTRLQVEHPVTELVTGLDLVAAQLRVAAGEPLGLTQDDVAFRGAAIECRICAEDPDRGFIPSPGKIVGLRHPEGPFVRVDSGIEQGGEVTMHYDPMIAKLIVWGEDRAQAIRRMARALTEYTVVGVRTTIPFHRRVMADPAFAAGDLSIRYLEEQAPPATVDPDERRVALLVACALEHERRMSTRVVERREAVSQWKLAHRARLS